MKEILDNIINSISSMRFIRTFDNTNLRTSSSDGFLLLVFLLSFFQLMFWSTAVKHDINLCDTFYGPDHAVFPATGATTYR